MQSEPDRRTPAPFDPLLDPLRDPMVVHLPAGLSDKRQALLQQLRDRYAATHGAEVLAKARDHIFAAELLQWDRDRIALLKGLYWALSDSVPVPKHLADVVTRAIALYLSGRRKSLDSALELSRPKGGMPKLQIDKVAHELRSALGRMFGLQLVGAHVPEAALLVSRLSPTFKRTTLEDRYRRGGYHANLKATRALGLRREDPADLLAEYPNSPREVAQVKAAIQTRYAKAAGSRT